MLVALTWLAIHRKCPKLNSGVCMGCPKGRYSKSGFCTLQHPRTIANDCALCPPGTYGSDDCSITPACSGWCPAGRYGAGGSLTKECTGPCAAGYYGIVGRGTPKCSGACWGGRYGRPGQTKKKCSGKCPAGRYSPGGASQCTSCPNNYFQPKKGKLVCHHCPKGKFSKFMSAADGYKGHPKCDMSPTPKPTPRFRYTLSPTPMLTMKLPTPSPSSPPTPKKMVPYRQLPMPTPPTMAPTEPPTEAPLEPVECPGILFEGMPERYSYFMGVYFMQAGHEIGKNGNAPRHQVYLKSGVGGHSWLFFLDDKQLWAVGRNLGRPPFAFVYEGDRPPDALQGGWQMPQPGDPTGTLVPAPGLRADCVSPTPAPTHAQTRALPPGAELAAADSRDTGAGAARAKHKKYKHTEKMLVRLGQWEQFEDLELGTYSYYNLKTKAYQLKLPDAFVALHAQQVRLKAKAKQAEERKQRQALEATREEREEERRWSAEPLPLQTQLAAVVILFGVMMALSILALWKVHMDSSPHARGHGYGHGHGHGHGHGGGAGAAIHGGGGTRDESRPLYAYGALSAEEREIEEARKALEQKYSYLDTDGSAQADATPIDGVSAQLHSTAFVDGGHFAHQRNSGDISA